MKYLDQKFFERSAVEVAEDLIGKYLVVSIRGKGLRETQRLLITETEAYEGIGDLASHASKGRTKRTEIMFGRAGRFYVKLVYGMYYMLNVVTGKEGHPGAVLIRGAGEFTGPGRLTRHLSIDGSLDGQAACPKTGVWFEKNPASHRKAGIGGTGVILKTPRIGVSYAGPVWSKKPWRFVLVSD